MNTIIFIVLVILFFSPLFLIVYSEMTYNPEDENTLIKNSETEDNAGLEPESYDDSDDESNKQMMNFVMMQNMIN